MSRIVLIASGDNIAKFGYAFLEQNPAVQDLDIVNVHMEAAVSYARTLSDTDIDAILARGNTAKMLRMAQLPFPVVTIPIRDYELMEAIRKAREAADKARPHLGYIGMWDTLNSVRHFLESMDCTVDYYPGNSTAEIEASIHESIRNDVDVVICGVYACTVLSRLGRKSIMIESSVESIREAYERSKEVQSAILRNQKKLQEKNTIINSVSEGIISITDKQRISSINNAAAQYLNTTVKKAYSKEIGQVFGPEEIAVIQGTLSSGEPVGNHCLILNETAYVMSINPILIRNRCRGAVILLREQGMLRKIEQDMRRQLYQQPGETTLHTFHDVLGESVPILHAVSTARQYAKAAFPILLIGAPGTGKHLFAQCIHSAGERANGPFIRYDCAQSADSSNIQADFCGSLDESVSPNLGLLEQARDGTLYLERIETLSVKAQSMLVEILETKRFRPVRQNGPMLLDTRLIVSTEHDLSELTATGRFSSALYHQLAALPLPLPDLSARGADLERLARQFVLDAGGDPSIVTEDVLAQFRARSWTGNLDELFMLCRRLVCLCAQDASAPADFSELPVNERLLFRGLPTDVTQPPSIAAPAQLAPAGNCLLIKGTPYPYSYLSELEQLCGGSKTLMAEKLGISRTTLWKILQKVDRAR